MTDGAILGIDPGVTGGIALYWPHDGMLLAYDMPTIGPKSKRVVSARGIVEKIEPRIPIALAVIEDIHGRRGWGANQTGRLMEAKGIARAVVDLLCIDPKWVQPGIWKKYFGLTGETDDRKKKAMARQRIIQLLPRHGAQFSLVKDHNKAEAALIALYGAKRFAS